MFSFGDISTNFTADSFERLSPGLAAASVCDPARGNT
jgi:hypothetical protein